MRRVFLASFNTRQMATKKRKEDAWCLMFNEKWGEEYFFVETDNHTAGFLICNESVAVLKEYNLPRHQETKRQLKYSKFLGKFRSEKF